MMPKRIERPTRAQAMKFADEALSELIGKYLTDLWARVQARGDGASPPAPPGPGLTWELISDDVVAREAARLGAWKQAELSRLTRWLDAEGVR